MQKISILAHTNTKELICALAASTCYNSGSIPQVVESISSAEKLIKDCMKSGHHSVLEHFNITFAIEGVSRVLTHQLVRHRIASYSQQSMRYVSFKEDGKFDFVTPYSIKEADAHVILKFNHAMKVSHAIYCQLIDMGIKPEDARYVLPNATETKIVMTMNARELKHFFRLRCCNRAQKEIRDMAITMLDLCKEQFPIIFDENDGPACVVGPCPEGSRSCGNPWKKVKEE